MTETEKTKLLDDLPFSEVKDNDGSCDLLYHMACQISELAQLILWIRCSTDIQLLDIKGNNIRKMNVQSLVGSFAETQSYYDFVKYDCNGKDPLDLSDYVNTLKSIYYQRHLAKGNPS